ncbi:MAG: hypothetical protein GX121_02795 [Ignavibacteria bacterium]|nr:hypothetical protein [Ignavibacteria bacterium]
MKTKLITLVIAIMLCFSANLFSQVCQCAQKIAGPYAERANSISTDASGNIYVAGDFYSPTLTFNNGISLSHSGLGDGYVAKYNNDGVCQWAQRIAGTSGDCAFSVSSDASGNVYVAGDFSSTTLSFNNGVIITNSGSGDAFLAKYNSIGVCQWAQKIAGTDYDRIFSISADASGNAFVVGYFWSPTITFNNGVILSNSGVESGFLAKYDSDGVCQWAEKIAGTYADRVHWVSLDANGNIYVAGQFFSYSLSFNNDITLLNSGSGDAFIAKYDSDGVCQWAEKIAGSGEDQALSINIDANGNVYVVGSYKSSILTFSSAITLPNSGNSDVFIAKYNSNGVCQWAEKIAGERSDFSESISVDANGNSFISGFFMSNTLEFNNGIMLTNSGTNSYEGFLAKYNSDGICQWAEQASGPSHDYMSSISKTINGNLVVSGYFTSPTLNLNNDITLTNSGTNTYDSFIALYADDVPLLAPVLSAPANNSVNQPIDPILEWQAVAGANSYTIQVSTENDFITTIINESGLEETAFQLNELDNNSTYFWRVNASDGALTSDWSLAWSFTTYSEINIDLNQGWNIISSNITPKNPLLDSVFASIKENIVFVKNKFSQLYVPAYQINQIGNWNIAHGYMVYVTAPATLQITGTAVDPTETEINLVTGWNLISYLRNSQMPISTALAGISSSIILVKNNAGQLYCPAYGLKTLGNMLPGQGYWIYMSAPAAFTYPGN